MKIVFAILIFGIVILIHELGHFIFARINGIEVVDFSIGMGPRLCGFKAWGTKFSVRLFPIGGACMMLGEDQNQKMDNEKSFYAKNVWQRIAVLFAGPGFNFILAFVFSVIIISMVGVDPAKVTDVTKGSPAAEAGLLEGDIITKINGSGVKIGRDIQSYFMYNELSEEPIKLTVKRDGKKVELTIIPKAYDKYQLGFTYSVAETGGAKIQEISKGYPFEKAGLKVGDVITAINENEIKNGSDLKAYLEQNPLSATEINVTYKRGDEVYTATVTPQFAYKDYYVGFAYNLAREKTNAFATIRYSLTEVRFWIEETAKGLGRLVTGKLKSDEIGSAVAIVDMIGDTYEANIEYGMRDAILSMLLITVYISANLGIMNLLPIPALDGGKLLFCAIEVIRRKPIDREKEGMVHFIGFVLLMILMVFLLFNDIKNVFFS